jgi:hypothetical protein
LPGREKRGQPHLIQNLQNLSPFLKAPRERRSCLTGLDLIFFQIPRQQCFDGFNRDWTISTNPENSHGELVLGDVLRFEFIGSLSGVIKPSAIQITRNGLIWQSASGWSGQCLSNGNSTQYVIGSDG